MARFGGTSRSVLLERKLAKLVFNTSLNGYQEIHTDPSYGRQFVLMTNPHNGNTGVKFVYQIGDAQNQWVIILWRGMLWGSVRPLINVRLTFTFTLFIKGYFITVPLFIDPLYYISICIS
ncbi:hypothetical protein SAY87_031481 [Trapa incisa]|uniref:Carbamoyl-phosphate synthase small subunit N-terminal domain-containing protein n=1 Tax=Trapa incisa TaxID=236973 RepID=A0AAN7KR67_9MYRT|nr:hypothetical protein SAY87_031481 [Trapa incisa]